MADLARSDFNVEGQRAWWRSVRDGITYVCLASGLGVLAALQTVLRNALRGGWRSYDGSHPRRPVIDGNFGPETMQALWAYAKAKNLDAALLSMIQRDGRARTISRGTMQLALWLTYYTPRFVDLDIGGERTLRNDRAILGNLPGDSLLLPDDAILWEFLIRPEVPADIGTLASEVPSCSREGAEWTLPEGESPPIPKPPRPRPRTVTRTVTRTVSNGGGGSLLLVFLLVATAVGVSMSESP